MTTLIVTEERSFAGAAQHPVLRAFYSVTLWMLKKFLAGAIRRAARNGRVVVLTIRALAPPLPPGLKPRVEFRFYDAVQERLPYSQMRKGAWRSVREFSQTLKPYSELTVDGIFLPQVFETQLAVHLLSEVLKYEAIVENIMQEFSPDNLVTLSDETTAEQTAIHLVQQKGINHCTVSTFGIAKLGERVDQYLRRREKKVWHDGLRALENEEIVPSERTGDVFIVAQQAGHHLKILAPLAKTLEDRHDIPTLLLADLDGLKDRIWGFSELPKHWSTIVHYLTPNALTTELTLKIAKFSKLFGGIVGTEPFRSYPISLVLPFVKNTFTYDFALASAFIPGIKRLFAERKPRAMITASDRRLNEVLFPMIAKQFNVPSMLATAITNMSLEMANNYDTCDVVAVPGEYIRDLMYSVGHTPDTVRVVGDLRFDDLGTRIAAFKPEQLKRRLGIPLENAVVSLMSSDIGPTWTESKKLNLFQTVHRVIQRLPGTTLLVKAHPNESVELLKKHMSEWGMAEVPVSSADHIHDVMLLSKVVLMLYSMAGLEAMLIGRPVVNVTLEGEDVEHYIPYVTGKGAIGVKTEQELDAALTQLLRDQQEYKHWVDNGKKFVSRFIRPVDGKVSDRIVELLKELEQKKQRAGS